MHFLKDIKHRFSRAHDPGEAAHGEVFERLPKTGGRPTKKAADAAKKERATKAKKKAPKREERGLYGFYRKYLHNFLGIAFVMSFFITFLTETLASQSIVGGFLFLFTKPLVFLLNVLLIFVTLTVAMFFKRKLFVFSVLAMTWLVLGVVNGIILRNRMTPFTTHDITELRDAMTIASNYFSNTQLTLIGVGIAALVLLLAALLKWLPKSKERPPFRRTLATWLVVVLLTFGSLVGGTRIGILDTFFPNLAYGYRDNGFNYCFLATWLDKGIRKPRGYSAESITGIFSEKELNSVVPGRTDPEEPVSTQGATKEYPNIIFVQLESFMDPTLVEGIRCSEDPIPHFRSLSQKYSTGKLQVPAMGAGTANTEFEVMSGMSVKFFGPGEYPHNTVLKEKTCETVAYDVKKYGYATHAIHNHRGAFYGRNQVYPNLGFDTFTSLEYMNGITQTPKNWAKDDVLPGQIFDALSSTDGKDYIFTISVQGHGKYPTEQMLTDPNIRVSAMEDEELRTQWQYFVNQLYDMDAFVGELTKEVEAFEEPTVVVFYGDHMPALSNISDSGFADGRNMYQTDYVIYSNFDMPKKDKDLYSYQLSAVLLDYLNIHNGTLVSYHQNHMKDKDYLSNLRDIQYDMLYGKQYIYDGQSPFVPLNMQMGVKEIQVTGIKQVGDKYFIQGENFTEYSKVNLDGEILETVYISPILLELKEPVDASAVPRMKVSQVEKTKQILSTSE